MKIKEENEKNRIKLMPDIVFHKLWDGAGEYTSEDAFVKAYTSSLSGKNIRFQARYGIPIDYAIKAVREIYRLKHLSFGEIMEMTGRRKAQLSHAFCIPIRTIENWADGTNECPGYIRLMMLKQYHKIRLGKYIITESEKEYRKNYPQIYGTQSHVGEDPKEDTPQDSGQEKKREYAAYKELYSTYSTKELLEMTSYLSHKK